MTDPSLTIDPRQRLPGFGPLVSMPRGVTVRLAVGSSVRAEHPRDVPMDSVLVLEGSAIVLVPRDVAGNTMATYVRTRGGWIAVAAPAAVRISAIGDTTVAQLLPLVETGDPSGAYAGSSAAFVYPVNLMSRRSDEQVMLAPGTAAHVVRGRTPRSLATSANVSR